MSFDSPNTQLYEDDTAIEHTEKLVIPDPGTCMILNGRYGFKSRVRLPPSSFLPAACEAERITSCDMKNPGLFFNCTEKRIVPSVPPS